MHVEQTQAALAVRRVLDGSTLRDALARAESHGQPLRGHALVQELVYGTLRHWGTLDALTSRLAAKPDIDPQLRTLMAVALYQLDHTRAPEFAVVDRAVDAAGALAHPGAKRWVNALLRRYLRERGPLSAAVQGDPVARWSYPRWWIARVKADFPDRWQSVLAAGNERPPLTLRVNARVGSREALLEAFGEHGIVAAAAGQHGVIVETPRAITGLPGYAEGAFSVQDLGAQWAAPLLDVGDEMRVLDACAAPGGKTTHMLEMTNADVTAVDIDAARLARVSENIERLRLSRPGLQLIRGDAAHPADWWDGRTYDRILADVPCSASGVVRRHPDGKWLRRADDIAAFARMQDRILETLWPLLGRGGKLLYVTCSVFSTENESRIAAFLDRTPDALREGIIFPADVSHAGGQLLPSSESTVQNQDGFFYALLRKA